MSFDGNNWMKHLLNKLFYKLQKNDKYCLKINKYLIKLWDLLITVYRPERIREIWLFFFHLI